MFEAVIAVCLSVAEGPCRDQLLPGYEAGTEAACVAALEARVPDINDLKTKGNPRCQIIGETLDFDQVSPGLFVHMGRIEEPDTVNRGDVSNIGFVVGDSGVAVIDTGTARWMGEAIWRAVRAQTDKPVTHVILSHMHPDHVLGADALVAAGAQVVGHAGLADALADREENYRESLSRLIGDAAFIGTRTVRVDLSVEDQMEIDLGNRVLTVKSWPAAHTRSDLTVLDKASGTLFTGDLIFHRHTPALDGVLRGWQAVLAQMEQMDVARIVPGHGGPTLPWPAGATDLRRYLNTLAKDTRRAIDKGQRLGDAVEEIAKDEADKWDLFEAYNPRNATVAFTELEWE